MGGTREVKLMTTGMHCPSCSMLIKMSVEDLGGVVSADSDYATGETRVVFDPDAIGVDDIIAEIVKAGYGAEVAH